MNTGQVLVWGSLVLLVLAADSGEPKQVEPKEPIGPGKPPGYVPMPAGWQRYSGTVSSDMKAAALADVNDGSKRFGTLTQHGVIAETGKAWGVLIEWHWHPKGQGFSAEGWHKGASLVVQK